MMRSKSESIQDELGTGFNICTIDSNIRKRRIYLISVATIYV